MNCDEIVGIAATTLSFWNVIMAFAFFPIETACTSVEQLYSLHYLATVTLPLFRSLTHIRTLTVAIPFFATTYVIQYSIITIFM